MPDYGNQRESFYSGRSIYVEPAANAVSSVKRGQANFAPAVTPDSYDRARSVYSPICMDMYKRSLWDRLLFWWNS